MPTQRLTIIILVTGLFFLGLSVFMYRLFGYSRVSRVFFFPSDRTLAISGEARRIPRQKTLEANIECYVKEWLLGPLELEHKTLFPRETKLTSTFVRDDRLYLDFTSPIILLRDSENSLSLREIADVITRGVTFNFPQIEGIFISVDGEPLPPEAVAE